MNYFINDEMDLTGLWRFQPDAFNEGERLGYAAVACETRLWREVSVPCAFDDCMPALAAYEGAGWFRREIELPMDWHDDEVVLRFEGVNTTATVWINGRQAGTHEGGFLRFELPVAGLLKPGRNAIAVRVDSTRQHGQVPGKKRGWRPYGGILREVALLRRPALYLRAPVMTARADGSYHAHVALCNVTANAMAGSVAFSILDAGGQCVARGDGGDRHLHGGSEATFEFDGVVTTVSPWSPEQPTLYTAVFNAGTVVTRLTFGFRTIERQGTQLMLNGKPLICRGFNRHEDSPTHGMVSDLGTAEADLRQMKALGANFVRLCHYPHHPGELDLCDRIGLLVMAEIPVYWWDGDANATVMLTPTETAETMTSSTLTAARRQLSEMIRRDINHPSVVFWSVSNETQEDNPEVAAGNSALIAHARRLDPTRLVMHVSDHWTRTPHFESDDVLCLNAYPSWDGRGWKSNPNYDLAGSKKWWDEALAQLHEAYPDRPILITEFGYPALYGVFGTGLGEDTQAQAIQAEAAAFDKPYVCGMTLWCYADHPWPEEPFINYLTTSPFGIVTRDRRRKKAYETVRVLFNAPAPARPAPDPLDNWFVHMTRPHLRDIPVVPFPDGYSVRSLHRNEGGLWEDIWRDAEEFFKIENGLFEREFGDDPAALERRCYIITAPDGVAAATISSWYSRDIDGLDYGRIHWVATRKTYQGRGIMRAGLSYALRQMAQWHERAILGTSTGRVAAIKLYLDYGFLPDLTPPGAREAWVALQQKLHHPALAGLE